MLKVVSFLFFGLLGVLLLNNGLSLGISEHLLDLCRDVAGACGIILAILTVSK
jgi:hypothetical protein